MRNIFKLLLVAVSFSLLLVSCFQLEKTETENASEFIGYVADKVNGSHQILVIPEIEIERSIIENSSKDKLKKLAIENGGVYFKINEDSFTQIKIRNKVNVIYDKEGLIEQSDPPQMEAEKVKILN